MKNTQQGYVKSTISKGIETITFQHPAHNSMPTVLLKKLVTKIEAAGKNKDTKVVILKSGGNRTFCAGANFDELLAIDTAETGKKFFMGFANVINAMRRCPKLIIGRVQGKAVGGGVGLAAATDYCFATQYASIKLSELSIGIGPFVIGPVVERKIGISAFSELFINAKKWQPANWAKQKGLFNEVFNTIDMMDESIEKLANELKSYNPTAMTEMKKTLWTGTENWNKLLEERAEISGKLVLESYAKMALDKIKNT